MSVLITTGNVITPSSPFPTMPTNILSEQTDDYAVTEATNAHATYEKTPSFTPTLPNPVDHTTKGRDIPESEDMVNQLICNDATLPPTAKQEKIEDEAQAKPELLDNIQNSTVFNLPNGNSNLPMRKRKQGNGDDNMEEAQSPDHNVVCLKRLRTEQIEVDIASVAARELAEALALSGGKSKMPTSDSEEDQFRSSPKFHSPTNIPTANNSIIPMQRLPMSKAREIRLEQNRKAARESRRRKKIMIEELQRSVIFFSRANGTLKQRNDELERLLLQANAQVQAFESGKHQAAAVAAQQDEEEEVKAESEEQEEMKEEDITMNKSEEEMEQQQQQQQQMERQLPVAPDPKSPIQPPVQIRQQSQPLIQQLQQHQTQCNIVQQTREESQISQARQAVACAQAQQHSDIQQHRDESQQVQAQQAVACAQAQQQAQIHAARAAATQAMFESHGFAPTAARVAAQTFITGSSSTLMSHVPQPQAQPKQPTQVDGSGNGCNPASGLQPQQTQMQQIPMQKNGGHNSWQYIMTMPPQPPSGSSALPGTHGNSPGQAQVQPQAQVDQSLQGALLAMQYNAAACNPLTLQSMPMQQNPSPAGMFGQQQIMSTPQQQQIQLPTSVNENPHKGIVCGENPMPAPEVRLTDIATVGTIGVETVTNL